MEYSPDKFKIFVIGEEVTGYAPDVEIKLEQDYEFNYDNEHMKEVVELSMSIEGIEVTGQTKEERIKTMKNIFNSY